MRNDHFIMSAKAISSLQTHKVAPPSEGFPPFVKQMLSTVNAVLVPGHGVSSFFGSSEYESGCDAVMRGFGAEGRPPFFRL